MCYNKNRIGRGRRFSVDKLMQPFILIYHLVNSFFMLPKKIFGKTEDVIIGLQDQTQLNKELKENTVSNEEESEDNFKWLKK